MWKIIDFITDLWALLPSTYQKPDPRWIGLSIILFIIGLFLFLFKWL